jgi:hypothetical protein
MLGQKFDTFANVGKKIKSLLPGESLQLTSPGHGVFVTRQENSTFQLVDSNELEPINNLTEESGIVENVRKRLDVEDSTYVFFALNKKVQEDIKDKKVSEDKKEITNKVDKSTDTAATLKSNKKS